MVYFQEVETKPLSVNKVWQGRRYKTKEYHQYERELGVLLGRRNGLQGKVAVELDFHLRNASRTDIDNPVKPLLDILTKLDWFEDDRNIWDLHIRKHNSKSDKVGILIKPYE